MTTQQAHHTPVDLLIIATITLVIVTSLPLLAAVGLTLQLAFVAVAPLVVLTMTLVLIAGWKRRRTQPVVDITRNTK